LVQLARQSGSRAVRTELTLRFLTPCAVLIRRLARRSRLPAEDWADALQNAALAILEAIDRYDLSQRTRPNGCRFATFVFRVIRARHKNFARSRRRFESRLDRSGPAEDVLETRSGKLPAGKPWDHGLDPVRVAQRHELESRVAQMIRDLDDRERRLVDYLWGEIKLTALARELGVSYWVARGEARQLVQKLNPCLHAWAEGTGP
jgi:RNA polymerase sigma factor (sigma-70 family)